MKSFYIILFLSFVNCILSDRFNENIQNNPPRIIIIGAGATGIAAASKLFEYGFNNITILEAENRIGGSIHTVEIGKYSADLGQYNVYNNPDEDNIVWKLASPLELINLVYEEISMMVAEKTFMLGSSGVELSLYDILSAKHTIMKNCYFFPNDVFYRYDPWIGGDGSDTEKIKNCLERFGYTTPDLDEGLDKFVEIVHGLADNNRDILQADISVLRKTQKDVFYWKENRGFSTVLNILMKKYPNPEKELPIIDNTILNSKVTKIKYYTMDGTVKVLTDDGRQYLGDYVIFTGSLGVLKADHEKLFDPLLPIKKIEAIENLGVHHTGYMLLYYENPWWDQHVFINYIFWSKEDQRKFKNDSNFKAKKWMLSVDGIQVHDDKKPKLVTIQLGGPYVRDMELLSEDDLREQILEFLNRFYGKSYNVTQPSIIKRSFWNSNENFRGIYSHPTVKSHRKKVGSEDIRSVVYNNHNNPVLHFAGGATIDYKRYIGDVAGAIQSGIDTADWFKLHLSTSQMEIS